MATAKVKIGTAIHTVPIPDGYRRVSNGYTRTGDKIYVPGPPWQWCEVQEMKIVAAHACVIRPV